MSYLPYLVFKVNNEELLNLREILQEDKRCAESIVEEYFTSSHGGGHRSSRFHQRFRVAVNVLLKGGKFWIGKYTKYCRLVGLGGHCLYKVYGDVRTI